MDQQHIVHDEHRGKRVDVGVRPGYWPRGSHPRGSGGQGGSPVIGERDRIVVECEHRISSKRGIRLRGVKNATALGDGVGGHIGVAEGSVGQYGHRASSRVRKSQTAGK